ncbi:hypothetical protein [Pseudomonas helleri]|jgi:hypothetical protein|uniref:Uncharacterized protein n=1 Tax=Pseudomonas helleri TaxID=1608996 RepID=A0A7X1WRD2_9PSED|nr:hypothetical protein [Pseudomonas helleri]MQT73335.1 hypothetical protein [Pseudomonas helleri]
MSTNQIATTKTTVSLDEILAAADMAYERGEMQLAEQLEISHRGDLLADFIAHELREATEGEDNPLEVALKSMHSAVDQLNQVIEALNALEA